ncbi:MAG: GntR family transcriptional regulator [Verrucomicrobiota bacterium]
MASKNESSASAPSRFLLQEKAYNELKERLLREELEGETFLSERQIAADLGMSKTPVKAAFVRLQHEGFVKISPQQGVVVRNLSHEEIADHLETRLALETYAARKIAGNLTDEQWKQLQDNLRDHAASAADNDVRRSVWLDSQFHILLVSFLGNREMEKIMEQTRDKMFRIMGRILFRNRTRVEKTLTEHASIADALREGRSQLAAELMMQHIERGREFLTSGAGQEDQ